MSKNHKKIYQNQSVEYNDLYDILKDTYLDVANDKSFVDMESKSDIVACVASAFRNKAMEKIEQNIKPKVYDPNFGDNRMCVCGHSYGRHFDCYDDMSICSCKYCECHEFKEISY